MKKSLHRVLQNKWKILWVLAQPVFTPVLLWVDDLRDAYGFWAEPTFRAFILLEILYLVDALLFTVVFGRDRRNT